MIAERAVKANRKVVNQRLLITLNLNGTETANYATKTAQSRRHGQIWWA